MSCLQFSQRVKSYIHMDSLQEVEAGRRETTNGTLLYIRAIFSVPRLNLWPHCVSNWGMETQEYYRPISTSVGHLKKKKIFPLGVSYRHHANKQHNTKHTMMKWLHWLALLRSDPFLVDVVSRCILSQNPLAVCSALRDVEHGTRLGKREPDSCSRPTNLSKDAY